MKTILLVDDESPLRLLVTTTLEGAGLRIIETASGLDAVQLAIREQPDLILLDWMLPGISGIDVAHELRKNTATATIPIIMLTARGQDVDKQKAPAAGVVAYLVKPFSPAQLIKQVQGLLGEEASLPKGCYREQGRPQQKTSRIA